jgi:hypothetical protein
MRLDHVSYVASHDQISDVVNRIGSQIGTVFIDGGIHPKFGTRNFTAPLLNTQYIEVVCPLDHPATDVTPFGQVVKQKLEEGGGWLAWVISTENIIHFEKIIERESVLGKRVKPNGEELEWRQLGVLNLTSDPELPFFIQWISGEHPSVGNDARASISKINIEGDSSKVIKLLANETSIFENINFTNQKNQLSGINSIEFNFNGNTVEIF